MDLARAPRRRPLTARKKGSGYENATMQVDKQPRPQAFLVVARELRKALGTRLVDKFRAILKLQGGEGGA